MRTLEEVRGRCFIDEGGHWLWRGATFENSPRIYGPNLAKGGAMESQHGRKVVWQMRTGMSVPAGWRVYGTCDEPMCVNPSCVACGKPAAAGRHIARTGKFKNQPSRVLANRAIGRKRASYTPEQLAEVQSSNESGWALARRLKLGRTVVARMRAGQTTAFTPIGGPFTGLIPASPSTQGAPHERPQAKAAVLLDAGARKPRPAAGLRRELAPRRRERRGDVPVNAGIPRQG